MNKKKKLIFSSIAIAIIIILSAISINYINIKNLKGTVVNYTGPETLTVKSESEGSPNLIDFTSSSEIKYRMYGRTGKTYKIKLNIGNLEKNSDYKLEVILDKGINYYDELNNNDIKNTYNINKREMFLDKESNIYVNYLNSKIKYEIPSDNDYKTYITNKHVARYGKKIYDIKKGINSANFNIVVTPDVVFDYLNSNITIKLFKSDKEIKVINKKVNLDLGQNDTESEENTEYCKIKTDSSWKDDAIGILNNPNESKISYGRNRLAGLYTYNAKYYARPIFFDYITIDVETSSTNPNIKIEPSKENIKNVAPDVWSRISGNFKDVTPSNYGPNKFKFKSTNFYNVNAGLDIGWVFTKTGNVRPEDYALITATKICYKIPGMTNEICVDNPQYNTQKFTFNDNNKITIINNTNREVFSLYNDETRNKESAPIGAFGFENLSPNAKKVNITYDFNKYSNVKSITVPISNLNKDLNIKVNNLNLVIPSSYIKANNYMYRNVKDSQTPIYLFDLSTDAINKYINTQNKINSIQTLTINEFIVPGYLYFTYAESVWFTPYFGTYNKNLDSNWESRTYDDKITITELDSNNNVKTTNTVSQKYKYEYNNKIFKVYPSLLKSVPNQEFFYAGTSYKQSFYIMTYRGSMVSVSKIYNPTIYFKDLKGIFKGNIKDKIEIEYATSKAYSYDEPDKLINKETLPVCNSNNQNKCYKLENVNGDTYKITTKGIFVGFHNYMANSLNNYLKITLNQSKLDPILFTENNTDIAYDYNKKIENNSNNVLAFFTTPEKKVDVNHLQSGELFEANTYVQNQNFYTSINTGKQFTVNKEGTFGAQIKQKSSNETNYKLWINNNDDTGLKNNETLNLDLNISKYIPGALQQGEIYIPIPKKGDNWGTLSNNKAYKFNMSLESIDFDSSKFKIEYSMVENTDIISVLNDSTINWKNDNIFNNISNANILRISIKNITQDNEKISLNFKSDDNTDNYLRNQFNFVMKDFSNNEVIIKNGNNVGVYIGTKPISVPLTYDNISEYIIMAISSLLAINGLIYLRKKYIKNKTL